MDYILDLHKFEFSLMPFLKLGLPLVTANKLSSETVTVHYTNDDPRKSVRMGKSLRS